MDFFSPTLLVVLAESKELFNMQHGKLLLLK